MATDLEDVERRTRPPRSRRKATRRDVICTILALLTAVFVAIVLRAVLGVDSSVVVGLGTYATFVCALVAAEVAAQRHEASEVVVDLPAVERAETADSSTATSVRDLFEDLDEPPSPAPVVVEPAPIIDDGPPSEDRPNRRAAAYFPRPRRGVDRGPGGSGVRGRRAGRVGTPGSDRHVHLVVHRLRVRLLRARAGPGRFRSRARPDRDAS